MNEDIRKKIEELQLVDEALQHEQLTKEDQERRLQLVKHPFVRKFRDLLLRNIWVQTGRLRTQLYKTIDTGKEETLTDIRKKLAYEVEASDEAITEEQLTKILEDAMINPKEYVA